MPRFTGVLCAFLLATSIGKAQQSAASIGDFTGWPEEATCCCSSDTRSFSTLRKELAKASLVVAGTLSNPRTNPADDYEHGVTDLNVDTVLKSHEILKGTRVLTLPRYIPSDDPKKPLRVLVFMNVVKGKFDPYHGMVLPSDVPVKYLLGAARLDPKRPDDALLYFLKHLESTDEDVQRDALEELTKTDYSVLKSALRQLAPAILEARLRKTELEDLRVSLYAFLLGHCGEAHHAEFMRNLIVSSDVEARNLCGLLIGYTLLKPKEGLAVMREKMGNPTLEFSERYLTLKALRFFWTERRDVLPRDEVLKAMTTMLDQEDIADIVIEDLRRQREERYTERILGMYHCKGFDTALVRQMILRFALSFPKNAKAVAFVDRMRAMDPKEVAAAEESLKSEP